MKVNVDYNLAHRAIEKFNNKQELNEHEANCITAILNASFGDLIPAKDELRRQESNVRRLEKCFEPTSPSWKRIFNDVREFENRYC
ncbi:hypothetical protein [Halalkalibacter oceani]|uniref:hypothetical protein n=1 Tax=Halalkalibacter oceani TaxID=1653776 RepID=UPI0033967E00